VVKGFIFLGPPGAGKGTQAQYFSKKFEMIQISTGDILRDAVKKATHLGKLAHEFMKKGELVPDGIMLSLIEEVLKEIKKDFLLDGFPRTVEQAKGLDLLAQKLNFEIKATVFIDVDDEEIVKRLSSRRICENCGSLYNMISNPPKRDELCDKCNIRLTTREDDKEETVRKRLAVYRRETEPLLKYYKEKGILFRINGKGKPDEVAERIQVILRNDNSQEG